MKRIISLPIIMALLTVFSLVGCSGNSDKGRGNNSKGNVDIAEVSESDFEVRPDASLGGMVITKFIGSREKIKIPEVIKGEPVVGIDNLSFSYSNSIEIVLPNTLKRIGEKIILRVSCV